MKDQLAYRRIAIAPELHRRVEKFAEAQKIPLKKAFVFLLEGLYNPATKKGGRE